MVESICMYVCMYYAEVEFECLGGDDDDDGGAQVKD
jgi:hypothetical protein